MTLGTNLLLQWWSQNQCPYASGMTLWVEADSWSSTVWRNKAPGAEYDLHVNSSMHAGVNGNAIVAPYNGANMDVRADRNVVGTGSWSVEAVLSVANFSFANYLMSQRTSTISPVADGQLQAYVHTSGNVVVGAYHPAGTNVGANMTSVPLVAGSINSVAFGYDADSRKVWRVVNGVLAENTDKDFSCNVNSFSLGNAMFTNSSFRGSLYSFRVWQRTLTSAELASNYAADRRRFSF